MTVFAESSNGRDWLFIRASARDLRKFPPASPAFFGSKKLRAVEKAVRTVEYGEEHRSVGRMRDMDVAARSPHEVTRANAAFRIFQRSLQHEGLFECGVLVQWHDRARRHPEQDGRASFVVLVQDLHLDSVEVGSPPGHRRRGDEGRPKFGRVDGQRLVHGFFSGIGRDRGRVANLSTKYAELERRRRWFEPNCTARARAILCRDVASATYPVASLPRAAEDR